MEAVAPMDIMLQAIEILNGRRFQNIKEAQKLGTTMMHAKQKQSLRNHTISLMIYYFLLL